MARQFPMKQCAHCGKPFQLKPYVGEPKPWIPHSIAIKGPQGQDLQFIVYLCHECTSGKSREELDAMALEALLAQCAPPRA